MLLSLLGTMLLLGSRTRVRVSVGSVGRGCVTITTGDNATTGESNPSTGKCMKCREGVCYYHYWGQCYYWGVEPEYG